MTVDTSQRMFTTSQVFSYRLFGTGNDQVLSRAVGLSFSIQVKRLLSFSSLNTVFMLILILCFDLFWLYAPSLL